MDHNILFKYFKGDATIEEEKQILDWVDASTENRSALQKGRMSFDIALFSDEKKQQKNKKTEFLRILQWSARIAAAIVFTIGIGFFL